jgi:hypothetical protein
MEPEVLGGKVHNREIPDIGELEDKELVARIKY